MHCTYSFDRKCKPTTIETSYGFKLCAVVCVKEIRGKKFKWRLQTKVICDVNKNRKNNMFTSCANNVAYRGLAESFH